MPALQHIVYLRLNDSVGSRDISEFNEQFKNIVTEIDGMLSGSVTAVEYAVKFKTLNKDGYTHCVYCVFRNIEGLQKYYEDSQEHEKLKGMIGKFIDGELIDHIVEFDSWNPALSSKL